MVKNVGIAGHLRAAFLGITAFVLLAAGAGTYAFWDISNALTDISQKRVPATLAAQKLTRRAEAIIDSAPKLLASEQRGAFEARSRNIMSDVTRLQQLVERIDNGELNVAGARFGTIVDDLERNLDALIQTVSSDLAVRTRIDSKLQAWEANYRALRNLLEPSLRVHREKLNELRRGIRQFEAGTGARRIANRDLRARLADYLPLRDLRVALAAVNDALIQAVESDSPDAVRAARARLDTAVDEADRVIANIDVAARTLMTERLSRLRRDADIVAENLDLQARDLMAARMAKLRRAAVGEDSIVALHARKLELQREAQTLLARNKELSQRLRQAVDSTVQRTRGRIDTALAAAERAKLTGAAIIAASVVLCALSVFLITRYYVGRNVVARLAAVRDSMLALSRGELDHPLPKPGADEIGRMTYALTVFRDNALRLRQRTRDLQVARDEAVKSSEAKTRFLANMSHELRTPLNAVIGFAEIIQNEAVGPIGEPRYRDYAKDIHDSATHLLDVINDILDVAKAEAGKLDLHDETVDLEPFIQKTFRLLESRAEKQGVHLEHAVDTRAPNLIADARRLRQVLLNLLSNAVKFTHAGGTVRVETTPREDGGLDVAVVDTGVGMSESEMETALAPFSQIDNSFSRHAEGTGLGLPLTKHLVELHGGSFHLASATGQGTRITASFPAARVPGAAGAANGATRRSAAS